MRYRRSAERRQIDNFQRPDPLRASVGSELSLRDDRTERRRSSRSRPPLAGAFGDRARSTRSSTRRCVSSISRGSCEARAPAPGSATRFLSHIRETDAVAMVVRCFTDDDVTHVEGGPDPLRDIEIINIEMALADLATLGKRVDKLEREARVNPKLAPQRRSREAAALGARRRARRRARSRPTRSRPNSRAKRFCSPRSRCCTSQTSTKSRSATPVRSREPSSIRPSASTRRAIAFCGKIEAELAGMTRRRGARRFAANSASTRAASTSSSSVPTTCSAS